jgi:nucleoside-diphosphate kinase
MSQTLILVKPDAFERALTGEVLARFERKGLRIVAMELRTIDAEVASRHYEEHQGKPFYPELIDFIGRSPSITMVLEGPEETWKVVRTLMGATNPRESAPGTIRGDFGVLLTENLVHGSDSPESAAREISIFFPDLT